MTRATGTSGLVACAVYAEQWLGARGHICLDREDEEKLQQIAHGYLASRGVHKLDRDAEIRLARHSLDYNTKPHGVSNFVYLDKTMNTWVVREHAQLDLLSEPEEDPRK